MDDDEIERRWWAMMQGLSRRQRFVRWWSINWPALAWSGSFVILAAVLIWWDTHA